MKDAKLPWITAGYSLFAKEGPKGLKVEVLARLVDKSKSSFYHHFADQEGFAEALLNYHLSQIRVLAEKEALCKNVIPDLLLLILECKTDFFFNRQLRINRHIPEYKACVDQVNQITGHTITGIWAEALGLKDQTYLANMVLALTIENFFLQLTEETMNYEWLESFIYEIRAMVQHFQQQPH